MRGLPILLLAVVAAVYGAALDAPPAYDDALIAAFPGRDVLGGFLHPVPRAPAGVGVPLYSYRPLFEASVLLDLRLFGPTGPALRIPNLLLHWAGSLLVLALARRLLGDRAAPWAALLFALHPLCVPAVTYVYQRAVLLQGVLGLLTLFL